VELIICRPGYTSLLDLAKLEKKLFVIPTPGQYEQEYLAGRLKKYGIANSCRQKEFTSEKLKYSGNYKGLRGFSGLNSLRNALAFFERK
jgi:UDP-N-acetylglucosamine:LPS N-acetylglucosamine transferase